MREGLGNFMAVACGSCLVLSGCSKVAYSPVASEWQEESSHKISTDLFVQGTQFRKLDILVVVDNSGSMAEEQTKLGDKIDSFLSTIEAIDWQLAITTTDVSDGEFGLNGAILPFAESSEKVLKKTTPDYNSLFLKTIVRPESYCQGKCASGDEQPIAAILMALQKHNNENQNFFREDADLAIIILSDEDEKSDGGKGATHPGLIIEEVAKVWQGKKKLRTYALIVQPGDEECLKNQGAAGRYGKYATSLVLQTGGFVGSICEEDYSSHLRKIGEDVKELISTFELSEAPVQHTIELEVSPPQSARWTLRGKKLYLSPPPALGSVIKVNYRHVD